MGTYNTRVEFAGIKPGKPLLEANEHIIDPKPRDKD